MSEFKTWLGASIGVALGNYFLGAPLEITALAMFFMGTALITHWITK